MVFFRDLVCQRHWRWNCISRRTIFSTQEGSKLEIIADWLPWWYFQFFRSEIKTWVKPMYFCISSFPTKKQWKSLANLYWIITIITDISSRKMGYCNSCAFDSGPLHLEFPSCTIKVTKKSWRKQKPSLNSLHLLWVQEFIQTLRNVRTNKWKCRIIISLSLCLSPIVKCMCWHL